MADQYKTKMVQRMIDGSYKILDQLKTSKSIKTYWTNIGW